MKLKFHIYFLVIILSSLNNLFGQNRWSRVFYNNKDATVNTFINSYDKGILLVGKHGYNYVNYEWLIKTNINGEILWEKTFGDPSSYVSIGGISYNKYGDLYLVGYTSYYNSGDLDPMIIKLDSCGEKQWCRVFVREGLDYSDGVRTLPNGNCVMSLIFQKGVDEIGLAEFSLDGDMLWQNFYYSPDSNVKNWQLYDFIIAPDGGYLISGYCAYEDPGPPPLWWTKPYFIKVDSMGNFEWETVVHKEDSAMGGIAWNASLNPDSNYYYASLSHYYPSADAAALIKLDMQGNVVDIYDLEPASDYGKMISLNFITDSTLVASAIWGESGYAKPSKAVIIDTLGNILNYNELINTDFMFYTKVTYDKKLLFLVNHLDEATNQFDAYLFKLNQDLEDDTMYTYPFQYDTLCPYPIASDTITQDDCGLIVGTVEWPPVETKTETEDIMEVFPNPASEEINCLIHRSFPSSTEAYGGGSGEGGSIDLFDIWGRLVESVEIPTGQSHIRIDVSNYTPGVYFVVLKEGKVVLGRKKVVVCD